MCMYILHMFVFINYMEECFFSLILLVYKLFGKQRLRYIRWNRQNANETLILSLSSMLTTPAAAPLFVVATTSFDPRSMKPPPTAIIPLCIHQIASCTPLSWIKYHITLFRIPPCIPRITPPRIGIVSCPRIILILIQLQS